MAESNNNKEWPLSGAARLLRRSRNTLMAAIAEGMPARSVTGDRGTVEWRVDIGHAAKWLEQRAVERERARLEERHRLEVERLHSALEAAGAESDEPATWQEARRRRAVAEARIREIDLAEREGGVVPVEIMNELLVNLFVGVRDRFRYLSGNLAPLVAAESSPTRCQHLIDAATREILTEIADSSPEKIMNTAIDKAHM